MPSPSNPPVVSVVVPAYNRALLIGATLEAILAQDMPPREVIVVDDGSTDATLQIVAGFHPRVTAISVANGGPDAARNHGVRAARGDLVAFCDSDDLWRPGFVRAISTLWREAPHILAAYGDFHIVRHDIWETGTKFAAAPEGFWHRMRATGAGRGVFDQPILPRLLQFQPFFPSAMMVHRERFLAAGAWDETPGSIVGSDFATALRMAEHPLGIVTEPLVGIRKHAGNFSADVQAMNLGDARILELCLAARPALQACRGAVLESIGKRRGQAADTAFDRRDFAAARAIYAMLPPAERGLRRRLKAAISRLLGSAAKAAAGPAGGLAG